MVKFIKNGIWNFVRFGLHIMLPIGGLADYLTGDLNEYSDEDLDEV